MRSFKELSDLTGRRALVTGGAGHIGRTMCETLVELGARVAVMDLDATACKQVVKTLNGQRSNSAINVPCDLTQEKATREGVQTAIKQLNGLDILIHCAGYVGTTQRDGWSVPFAQQTVAAFDAGMSVNLTAAFIMAQTAQSALEASGRGSIILLGSIYGVVGPDMRLYEGTEMVNTAAYNASKGALLQLNRYLATLLAPRVRVNAISPGGVWRNQPEKFKERYQSRTPLARMATEEDLKGAVAYLASDLSAYVTGQNLLIDGGWTAW
jgi:NAD(P)-dependent dehydrogenase (short-subunit alcohol dehydrogenase family)